MWQKKKIESFIKRNYKTCPVYGAEDIKDYYNIAESLKFCEYLDYLMQIARNDGLEIAITKLYDTEF